MQTGGESACLDNEDVGDVGDGAVVIVVELQERLLVGFQSVDSTSQVIDARLIVECLVHLRVGQMRVVIDAKILDALFPQPRDGGGIGDATDPGRER